MTREEAIARLQEAKSGYTVYLSNEALDMATAALYREQQFLDAGYKNGQVEFYIGGRKFMVRELAQ